ncbi:hypothetical protein [Nocardia wallacei]|uniref:hypothetical protein n=1 Tax=Nocardia wallacei TaxID=480035 RepID=UPI00245499E3|nr:hypothetical protein [Nocardia wallacei]
MTDIQCTECSRPLGSNAALCRECIDGLRDQLLTVPALVYELAITRAGLARNGPPAVGSRPAEPPLPIRVTGRNRLPGESAVQRLETTVIGWARVIAEDLGVIPAVNIAYLVQLTQDRRLALRTGQRPDAAALAEPASPLEQAAVWLAHHRLEIARHEAAAELAREVGGAVRALGAVIWPLERQYLGLCAQKSESGEVCGQELRAELGATYTRCRRCRTQYEVRDLKAEAIQNASKRLYTLYEIVGLAAAFATPVPKTTLYRWARERKIEPRGWAHRNEYGTRITDHPVSERDPRVYRLGDVLALAERETEGSAA